MIDRPAVRADERGISTGLLHSRVLLTQTDGGHDYSDGRTRAHERRERYVQYCSYPRYIYKSMYYGTQMEKRGKEAEAEACAQICAALRFPFIPVPWFDSGFGFDFGFRFFR